MKLIFASGLEEKFLKEQESLLALGGWLYYDSQKKLEKNFKNLEYDYLDKKFNIRTYIPELRTKLLNNLSLSLNQLHHKKLTKEFWTAIIDPWLSHYLIQNYFRWCLIKRCCQDNKNLRSIFFKRLDYHPPFDQNDYFYLISNSNSYNQFVFQRIYDFSKKDFPNLEVSFLDEDIEKDNSIYELKKRRKNIIITLYEKFVGFFSKKNFFYFDLKCTKFEFLKLNFFLNQIPFKGITILNRENLSDIFNKKFDIDINKRKKIKIEINSNSFEKFISKHISNDLPSSLIENFNEINNLACKISLSPKIIFSDTEYMHNTFFKFWLGHKLDKKIPFYTSQHGGYWGNNRQPIYLNDVFTQKNIKWHIPLIKNSFQMPVIQLTRFLNFRKNYCNFKKILIIGHNTTKFPRYLGTGPVSNEIFDQVDILNNFISKLNEKIKKEIYFRPYKPVRYWKIERDLQKKINFKKLENNLEYFKIFKKSRIIITTHPRTAFLEALVSGPTIIILNENYYSEDKELDNAMQQLKKAKIMFTDSNLAAKHLNEVWNSVDDWWLNENTVNLKNIFLKAVAPTEKKALNRWINFCYNQKRKVEKNNEI